MFSLSTPAPKHTVPTRSPASQNAAKVSELGLFREAKLETHTGLEISTLVVGSFGEWPLPRVDHPDSTPIDEFLSSLIAEGHGEAIAAGRRTISSWIDSRPSLRALRMKAGLSQAQLAMRMGTSQPQIARMESGKQDLQLSTMKKLAGALSIDIHQVLDAING